MWSIAWVKRSCAKRSADSRHARSLKSATWTARTLSAIERESGRSRRIPVTPSRTASGAPPARAPITGVPHACASTMAMPKVSTDGQISARLER
jgi:hypothetical protein